MLKNVKKLICLLLVVTLSASMFTGCFMNRTTDTVEVELSDMTTEKIKLKYAFWEDGPIVELLKVEWNKLYPNIELELMPYETPIGFNEEMMLLSSAMDLPDVFWLLNECDFAIENGMLLDMTPLWEADPDSKNVLPSINKYKLGYFGTDYKWTTPVKYFPSAAFLNKNLFERTGRTMPNKDWTWDEYEKTVAEMTFKDSDGKQVFGFHCNSANWPVTWYPIAADENAQGEFGWDGKQFHMTNWAEGLNKGAKWKNSGYCAPDVIEECLELYGESQWAQDIGYVAIQTDYWWVWERYWDTDTYYDRDVIWVPYIMPHVEGVNSETIISVMDFGGISAVSKNPREAYELLKYMTWGEQGWAEKLKLYPECKTAADTPMEKNNFPICTSEKIWQGFREWHPMAGDKYGREEYFDYYFDHLDYAFPLGATQIPGFATFFTESYDQSGAVVETAVYQNGEDAHDYVEELEKAANDANQRRLDEIDSMLTN